MPRPYGLGQLDYFVVLAGCAGVAAFAWVGLALPFFKHPLMNFRRAGPFMAFSLASLLHSAILLLRWYLRLTCFFIGLSALAGTAAGSAGMAVSAAKLVAVTNPNATAISAGSSLRMINPSLKKFNGDSTGGRASVFNGQ